MHDAWVRLVLYHTTIVATSAAYKHAACLFASWILPFLMVCTCHVSILRWDVYQHELMLGLGLGFTASEMSHLLGTKKRWKQCALVDGGTVDAGGVAVTVVLVAAGVVSGGVDAGNAVVEGGVREVAAALVSGGAVEALDARVDWMTVVGGVEGICGVVEVKCSLLWALSLSSLVLLVNPSTRFSINIAASPTAFCTRRVFPIKNSVFLVFRTTDLIFRADKPCLDSEWSVGAETNKHSKAINLVWLASGAPREARKGACLWTAALKHLLCQQSSTCEERVLCRKMPWITNQFHWLLNNILNRTREATVPCTSAKAVNWTSQTIPTMPKDTERCTDISTYRDISLSLSSSCYGVQRA